MRPSDWISSQGRLWLRALSLFALAAFISSLSAQSNLIYNPDFELGNEGFFTEYSYNPTAHRSGTPSMLTSGQYLLTANPGNHHPDAHSFGDFTTGDGLMLMVKGATVPNRVVWQQIIAVDPGQAYAFSGWISVWTGSSPPALRFTVNDEEIGVYHFPETPRPGVWYNWYYEWQGGDRAEAVLTIVDLNTSAAGNGFVLDGLEFYVVPEPSSLLLLFAGVGGLAVRCRRATSCV